MEEEPFEDDVATPEPHIVFRVRMSRANLYAVMLGVLGAALGSVTPTANRLLSTILLVISGIVLGALWGRRRKWDVCSDSDCSATLEPGVGTCPGCGGNCVGSLRRRDDLLNALEEYEEQGHEMRSAVD